MAGGGFFFDSELFSGESGPRSESTGESLRTVLFDGGARWWDSGRRADVVGVPRDASLVVPRLVIGGGGGARTPSRRHASPATPSTRRQYDGVAVRSLTDRFSSTAALSPRNDFVKNCRCTRHTG